MRRHIRNALHHAHHTVRVLRSRRILTRSTILAVLIALNIVFALAIVANTLSIPNTYVGTVSVGMKTRRDVRFRISEMIRQPVRVAINGKTYETTYEHLGIYINTDAVVRDIFTPDSRDIRTHSKMFVSSLFSRRSIPVSLSFTQEFFDFIGKINAEGLNQAEIVYISQDNKRATLVTPQQRYQVNIPAFQDELRHSFGHSGTITAPLSEVSPALERSVADTNDKLESIYGKPITLVVGLRGENYFFTITPEELRRYTLAHLSAENGHIRFAINDATFRGSLTDMISARVQNFNRDAALTRIGNGIVRALETRFSGGPADSVRVGIDSGPNTDGTYAKKYIEIDISQQRMFTYKDGNLVKSYRVSTGKDYPTPTGTFQILNKTGLGYSGIYHVWMPYWMGFSYSKELRAYFGIHELPYFYNGDQKIQRPREFIGAPNTGGCVALDIGDSKEVYQFADIGTPVMIFP